MKTILTNCTVIDCTGKPPMTDMTIVIERGKIAELKPGIYKQEDGKGTVRVFDLEGGYLLPGLWDAHVHLFDLTPDPKHLLSTESAIDCAIRGGRQAMDALRAGITGIRVLGDRDFIDLAWKRAFDAGVFVGPRIYGCGQYICATGGHGWEEPIAVQVDGPYEMRKVVREQLKRGADGIKLAVTGGIGTAGESMYESQFLLDEIRAATEVAHQKGKRVTVHAGGAAGVKTAIRGGVDCIEHGYYLDDEAIEMMVESDVFYVPTIRCTQDRDFINEESGLPEFFIQKARAGARAHLESFQKALRAGLKIASGADQAPSSEMALREIEHLVRAGMTGAEALVAATRTSADLCGLEDRLGTVEVGKLADLIVVSANPLEDISNIRKLRMVLKGGNLVDTSPQEGLVDFSELFRLPLGG
jgi:imidazolonepropionase-like amidohydrolase